MKQSLHKSAFFPVAILAAVAALLFPPRILAQRLSPYALAHKPPDTSRALKPFIGEYGPADAAYIVLENQGRLILRKPNGEQGLLQRRSEGNFLFPDPKSPVSVHFLRADSGSLTALSITVDNVILPRRRLGPDEGQSFQIKPLRSIEQLRQEALSASPPHENGQFHDPELVDLTSLDPGIHLDIRYATSNDFLGTPVYTQARAFLQRPAADALVRALLRLKPHGYGLLVHDAYRPWYVTKIFWDATPPEGKIFVADPAQGSRHNRGCAVDLTLYELKTGKPIEMPGTYDEMSPRSFPDYPGGTSLQRWHRDLLRWAMESEGFTVYEHEWWHFDYKDWHEYPILNVPFEKLQLGEKQVR
jgi:D-alanyl-D-alanine dipeptidase